jgi:hypothetical protein
MLVSQQLFELAILKGLKQVGKDSLQPVVKEQPARFGIGSFSVRAAT